MSGTNTSDSTASGTPVSALPTTDTVAATDGVLGVFGGDEQLASPQALVKAGLPDNVVTDDSLADALSNSSLGQYTQQAAQSAASSKADADRSETAEAAASASASNAAASGVQIATIATGVKADADRAEAGSASAQAVASSAGTVLAQNTALASLVANNPAQFTNRGGWDASKNSPTLASGAGTEGDLYIVTVEGSVPLDGVSSWAFLDGAWFHDGAWSLLPRAGYPAFAQTFQALQRIIVGQNSLSDDPEFAFSLRDIVGYVLSYIDKGGNFYTGGNKLGLGGSVIDTSPQKGWMFSQQDQFGNVGWGVREDGSPAFPSVKSAELGAFKAEILDDGENAFIIKDALGFVLFNSSWTSSDTTTADFSASEIAERDNRQLARSAAIMAGPGDLLRARPVWGISLVVTLGQSEQMGFSAVPVLTRTQPYDNVTFGADPRGQIFSDSTDPWTPRGGSAALQPLIGLMIDSSSFKEITRGYSPIFTQPSAVTVAPITTTDGSHQATVSTTDASVDFTKLFEVGDYIQFAGFTGTAASMNQGGDYWDPFARVLSVTASSLTLLGGGIVNIFTPVAVTNASGVIISILWVGGSFYGEQNGIAMLNLFRALQLKQRGYVLDSTRRMALISTCVSGMALANLSKGKDQNVYNRNIQSAQVAKAEADSLGLSIGLCAWDFLQGGSDTGTDYDTYYALLKAYHEDLKADVLPVFGQTEEPFFIITPISGANMPNTGHMDVCRAQVDYAFATPGCYIPTVGYPAIDYGAHYTTNGQHYVGAQKAKVMHRVITQGLGWKPLIMERATLRGRTVLIDCHVPCPPLRVLPVFVGLEEKTFNALGFSVSLESGPNVPILSATIVGDTQIELTLGAIPTEPIWVWYGSAGTNGSGNIFDSDPATTADVYEWTLGSGASFSENIPSIIGKPFSLSNPMINYAMLSVEG